MKICVTEKHIKAGKTFDACNCPIALAMTEAGVLNVEVDYYFFTHDLQDPEKRDKGFLREKIFFTSPVTEFIQRFDQGKPVKPFEFETFITGDGIQ